MKIFFSYGHDENKIVVDLIKEIIESKGHKVWVDYEKIKSGDDWRTTIQNGIKESDDIVAFVSKHSSREGGVCSDELKIAVSVRGAIVKIALLEPMEQVNLSASLLTRQALDLSHWKEEKEKSEVVWKKWIEQKSKEILNVIESEENKQYYEEIGFLKKVLNPYLGDSKETALLRNKYYKNGDIETKILDWVKKDTYRQVLCIYGGPGLGKSMLAANLQHDYSNVICSIFCQIDKPQYYNVDTMIRTMAFKIAIKQTNFRKRLISILEEEDRKNNENENKNNSVELKGNALFENIVLNPMNHLIDGGMENQIIVIDGLDEADESRDEFADIIIHNSKYFPKWIKFLLTTRPEPEIMKKLGDCEKLQIKKENNNIKEFVSDKLENLNLSQKKLNTIVEKCDGAYLFAQIICEDIKWGNISLNSLEQIPEGISAYFSELLRKKFQQIQKYDLVNEILSMMCGVIDVSTKMMAQCIGVECEQIEQAVDELGYLINKQGDNYSIFHKEFLDFVTDKKKAGEFYVNESRGNQILADYIHEHMQDVEAYYFSVNELLSDMRGWSTASAINIKNEIEKIYKEKYIVYDNAGEILVAANRWDDYIHLLKYVFKTADIQKRDRIWDDNFANTEIKKYVLVQKMIKYVDYLPFFKYDISSFIENVKCYIPACDIRTREVGYHDVLIPGVLDFRELDQLYIRTERVASLVVESIQALYDDARAEWPEESLKYFELVYYMDRCVKKCEEAGIPNMEKTVAEYERKRIGILTSIA